MEKGTMSFTTGEGLGIIQFGNPSELFSDKTFEVVFYLPHRMSSQEIANQLSLAKRTIENYTQEIFDKSGHNQKNSCIIIS